MAEGLFSLEPPAGYALRKYKATDEHYAKMMTKLKYVVLECNQYAAKNDGKWPQRLEDLTKNGMDANALRTLLAPLDRPNGAPVMIYERPRDGNQDGGTIVVYETPESRRDGLVVCGFLDGHSEVIKEKDFEEAMKKQ